MTHVEQSMDNRRRQTGLVADQVVVRPERGSPMRWAPGPLTGISPRGGSLRDM
jgi:hypothetical protein